MSKPKSKEITAAKAIKVFFEMDGGTKVTMEEMKSLSKPDRDDLGKQCALALGMIIKALA